MRGRGRHSSSPSSATQQQSRMALRKKLAQNVSSDSQQDENTQEDIASTDTESRDEFSSLLRSTSLAREKRRRERKNHSRRKEMTEDEEMDLALQLSKQEASNTALRQQQEDENVMKAIQESMVNQTQPGLKSPNKHLLDGVPQSTGSRRKLSYSNGERMPEEGGMNSGAVGPGDEIITRRKKRRKQAGSPLMGMPELSQTQKVSSENSPSITEPVSAHLDSPQSSDSTDIEDSQLQMSPVFPLTGCRADVHVSRLNLDVVEACKSSGFVLYSQDSLISTQKSAQPRSPVFPQSNPIFCPKSPVFPGDDMGRERHLEQSPTFVKSPVFGRTADCSNHPACENTELSFSSQESSNPTVRSGSPQSPVFHKSPSGQSSFCKDPRRGQVERRDERSTSPAELQRTDQQLRASDRDQSPSGCRKDIKSGGCPTAECNRHSPKSEEVNENCEGWTSAETELTSDMTLIWSEQEEDDITPTGSLSPVFPEEKAVVPADNQLGSSPNHVLTASQEPSGPDCSLKPQKCSSQPPTSALHPVSRQEEVRRASPQRGEPSDRQTIHYYWGVPFCPRGLDPDTYTKVIVAQMEVYEKSLKEAQRGLLRKAEWGEAIQSEPQVSMQTYSSYNMLLGLAVALLSSFLIGGSVILKKKALIRLASNGHTRAGEGGYGYLKDWLWWGGLLTMGAGEVCNFAAYMFAPATLVTPLGALSVLISAVLSSHLLGEQLNVVGKFGCLLCVLGSILLVIHAPQEREVTSIQDMTNKLLEPGFLVYVVALLVLCAVLVLYFCPRSGRSNILIYIGICSLLGAFTISSVKGLAIAINTVVYDTSVLSHPLTWILLLTLIVSIVTQVNYLNKSLDTFNTLLVYPIYYVLFTSVVLSTSIILFQEWSSMSAVDVVTTLGSFLVIVVGVALLHLFRELQITMKQLTNQLSQPVEREGLTEEVTTNGRGGRNKKEDKYGLMDNVVIESLPPMREEGPRVFIIS